MYIQLYVYMYICMYIMIHRNSCPYHVLSACEWMLRQIKGLGACESKCTASATSGMLTEGLIRLSTLGVALALLDVISCASNALIVFDYSILSWFCLCLSSHMLRNNLRVDDLKVFVLDEASFLCDFPNCFFKVCCFKGFYR